MKTKGTTTDAGSPIARGVDQALATAHDAINALSDAAKPAVGRMTSGAHDVAEQVSDAATQAAKQLRVSGKKLQKMEKRLERSARGFVREHPLASLGMALAAGYVVARLLSPREDR
jgi:ElaB/YqjD/DUF883 family membrane-anchored ribosome-binding protein